MGFALLLAACAGLEVKMPPTGIGLPEVARHVPPEELEALARAKPCCSSLADLPYRPIEREGPITLDIGTASPAFAFDGGKSFFAALRLPDWPRPLALRIRSAGPQAIYDPSRPIFSPAVLVLDAQFRIRRVMKGPGDFQVVEGQPGSGQPGIRMEGDLYIGESAQEAAYLIVLTTDELRERHFVSKGLRIHGFSPTGPVDLEVHSAPFLDLPVRYRGQAVLVDPGRPLSGDLFWQANELIVDESGLHYVEDVDGRWVERLSLPRTRLVAARVFVPFMQNARLELDTIEQPGSPIVRHTVALLPPPGSNQFEMHHVAALAAQGVRPGWHAEEVAVVAATSPPIVEFRDPPPVSSGAAGRIADKAVTGGVVTAGICGICLTGFCPPEMLLLCAGLFAVGAAVGGAVGVGGEVIAGNTQAPPQPPALSDQQVQGASPIVGAAAGTLLGQGALRDCVQRRIADGGAWVHQGRAAVFVPDKASAPFTLEVAVQRVSLLPAGQPGQALEAIPVQMRVDGGLVLRHAPPKPQASHEWQRSVTWQGPSYTLADWSATDGRVLAAALREACQGLAASLMHEAAEVWSKAH